MSDAPSDKSTMRNVWQVWAVDHSGDTEHRRFFGGEDEARTLALGIARHGMGYPSGIDRGAISVWVLNGSGEIVWAAGEKATELRAAGVELNEYCDVIANA